ncbi:MAG: hypothetical protein IKP86_09775 [Anaerolineaceae bacterium]|nr:hypothetical protein [Anaerolineaceae bacterium]
MIDYSDPIHQEIRKLLHQYAQMDPDGFWDESEWEAWAWEHASDRLRKYIKKEGKYWFDGKPRSGAFEGGATHRQTSN